MSLFPCLQGGGAVGELPIEDGTQASFTNGSTLPAGKYYFLAAAHNNVNGGGYSDVSISTNDATLIKGINTRATQVGQSGAAGVYVGLYYAELDGSTSVTFTATTSSSIPVAMGDIYSIQVS